MPSKIIAETPVSGHVAEMMDMGWPTKGGHIPFSDTYFKAIITGTQVREITPKRDVTRKGEVIHKAGVPYEKSYGPQAYLEEGPRRKTKEAAEADLRNMKEKHGIA